jgi:hypothetical protein
MKRVARRNEVDLGESENRLEVRRFSRAQTGREDER